MSTGLVVAKKRGPVPASDPKRVVIAIKATPEYKAWLEAFADSQRDIPSRMIDLGLMELAKKFGFKMPPKR